MEQKEAKEAKVKPCFWAAHLFKKYRDTPARRPPPKHTAADSN
jgi:hypothetical protein